MGLGFRVQGLGFRVWGLGFRVWGLGFRVSECLQQVSAFAMAHPSLSHLRSRSRTIDGSLGVTGHVMPPRGLIFRVWGLGFRV